MNPGLHVVYRRVKEQVPLGDGNNKKVFKAIRMHGNAIEYVPLCLLLIFLLENKGADGRLVHAVGIMLTAGRILHPIGIFRTIGVSIPRFVGTNLTFIALITAAAGCLYYFFNSSPIL
ncbi:MAPEG family protein [bacterium]|nr:MAPEG family protein [bacterium]